MSAGAPWSVKGIDPKAREVAKDLARRSGMTLGEWLNHVILEDDTPEEVASEAQMAVPRLRAVPASPQPDLSRVAVALDRLTERIETSETRTGLAISGVEHSVRHALARIETAEREQLAIATRLESQQGQFGERLRRLEVDAAGPRSGEALRLLDAQGAPDAPLGGYGADLLERLGERLAQAEHRTSDALDQLTRALAGLDGRVAAVEGGEAQRFEDLAATLSRQVQAARVEFSERLAALPASQVDARLDAMAEQLRLAERRSAKAIERMGREVIAMAEALNRRLGQSEQRSAEAIEQVGGEIARIAGAVEGRLGRTEQAQAEALERLGAEIGRITDRLAERMSHSERRAAQAIDDVGEQVAKVTERIEQRHERAAADLAERIRQSEARTAELLSQARTGPGLTAGDEAPPPNGPFGPELFSRAEPLAEAPPLDPGRPVFAAEDFAAAETFAPIPDREEDDLLQPAAPEKRPLSTREVIDQARAAARANQPPRARMNVRAKVDRRAASGRFFAGFNARPRRGASALQTALMVAGGAAFLSVGAAGVVLMEGPAPQSQQATGPGGADTPRAAVALAPARTEALPRAQAPADPKLETAYAEAARLVAANRPGGLAKLKAAAEAGHAGAQFHLGKLYETGEAGVGQNLAEARRWTALAAEGGEPKAMHNLGLYYFRGEGGPQDLATAALWFRKAAVAGVVDSQFNLGVMYQSGSGVQADPVEALKWFSAAAARGDSAARSNAEALKAQLGPAARTAALDAAAAKQILARLGYYEGALDAAASPAFTEALARYQREQGLTATGALDAPTVARLSAYRR